MPLFEFKCSSCSNTFEELVFGGRLPEKCPQCGSCTIDKLLSACNFKSAGGNGSSVSSAGSGGGCSSCSSKNCSSCR